MKQLLALTLALAGFAVAGTAQAAQLVQNGGFETGDFTDWTQGGNTGFTFVEAYTDFTSDTVVAFDGDNLGTYAAFLGPISTPGTLSQTLNTVIGDTYRISFDLANYSSSPNSFEATFAGNTIINVSDVAAQTFTPPPSGPTYLFLSQYSNTFTATSDSTLLEFNFVQTPSYFVLDDVQVVGGVPEPATWALMLIGFAAIGLGLRGASRRNPQVTIRNSYVA